MFLCLGRTSYLLSTPGCNGNNTGGCCKQLHGSLTLAPSLWPDRELRKYHYRLHPLSPPLPADKF